MGLSHEQNKETKVQCRCFLFVCQEDQQEVGHEAAPLITTRGLSLPVSYLRCHSHTCVRVASAVFSPKKIAESWGNLFSPGEKNVSASHPGSRGTRSPHSVQSADDDRNVQAQEPSTSTRPPHLTVADPPPLLSPLHWRCRGESISRRCFTEIRGGPRVSSARC